MRFQTSAAVVSAILIVAAPAVIAHHSVLGQFDLSKSITLKGTIAKVDWINPHPYVHLNVSEPNGTATVWALSTIPIAMMREAGIAKENGERIV